MRIFRIGCAAALCLGTRLDGQESAPRVLFGGEQERGGVLTRLVGVAVVGDRFVLLDAAPPALRLVAADGRIIQTLGGHGAGPGEYRSQSSVHFDSAASRLHVVDPQNARVTSYSLGDSLVLESTLSVDLPMLRSICRSGDQLVGQGGLTDALVHRLRVENNRVHADPLPGTKSSHHELAAYRPLLNRIGTGPMACSSDGAIAIASPVLGEVMILPRSNATPRVIGLPGFAGLRIAAASRSGLIQSLPPSKEYDFLVDVQVRPGGFVATTAHRVQTGPREETVQYYWNIELGRDGTVTGARRRADWRQVGILNKQGLCYREDPVPTIALSATQTCP